MFVFNIFIREIENWGINKPFFQIIFLKKGVIIVKKYCCRRGLSNVIKDSLAGLNIRLLNRAETIKWTLLS